MANSWRGWAGGAVLVAVLGAAVACSGSGDHSDLSGPSPAPAPVPTPVQQDVGASGGAVTNTEGTGVDIPPGAVPGNVTVSVTPAPAQTPPPAAEPVGTPYVFGPSGIQFAKPVTVTLAFDPTKLPAGTTAADIVVFTAPDGTTNFERLKTAIKDATHVTAETTHFSIFMPTVQTGGTCTTISCQPTVCGTQDDGCGGTMDCGACPTPDSGCTALLCGAYGPGACGTQSNGCGGTLDCGACQTDAGTDSGTGGSDSGTGGSDSGTGGADASAPDSGSGGSDGGVKDGGSGSTDAGSGGSDAGVSDGGSCMPLTCANYPNACGTVGDGCGKNLDCTGGCDGGVPDSGGGSGGGMDASAGGDGGSCKSCDPMGCGWYDLGCGQVYCSGGCDGGASADGGSGGGMDGGACGTCTPQMCGYYNLGCGLQFCGGGCSSDGGASADGGGGGAADGGACIPVTCGPMDCGPTPNGCGGLNDCACAGDASTD